MKINESYCSMNIFNQYPMTGLLMEAYLEGPSSNSTGPSMPPEVERGNQGSQQDLGIQDDQG